jgi:hypothetical protein
VTKLNSALPKGESNGLAAIARKLIDDPQHVNIVIALVDCKSTTTDNDTGEIVPTARIRRIEPITDSDKDVAAKMLRRAMERRTGKTVLPFDLEEDLRAVLNDDD